MNNVRRQRRNEAAMTSHSSTWDHLQCLTPETRKSLEEWRVRQSQKNLRKSEFTRAQSSPQTLEGS